MPNEPTHRIYVRKQANRVEAKLCYIQT